MSRPLIISDCDGVLVQFAAPFGDYLAEAHDMTMKLDSYALAGNVRTRDGDLVPQKAFPALLDGFFRTHMPRQQAVHGAAASLARLATWCDVVVLTNIKEVHAPARTRALAELGMGYEVLGNDGPKGPPIQALLARFQPSVAVFIDDLPHHHASVAALVPQVHRLHMVAEDELRHLVPEAKEAHARIDFWAEALPHIEVILGDSK